MLPMLILYNSNLFFLIHILAYVSIQKYGIYVNFIKLIIKESLDLNDSRITMAFFSFDNNGIWC